jgi:hypothetical protein
MWAERESSGSSTAAIPPCAHAVLPSSGLSLGDDQDLSVLSGVQSKAEPGNSRADDQKVGLK